ncbi:MAG: GNAT family N-acetyltransferase [Ruthenibacterium lactatiformans]
MPGERPAVFHGWAGREDCCRYLPWEPCAALQETQVRLENWLGRYAEPDFLQWAVTLRESGTLAGVVNLHGVDEAHCCAETSYALSPAYRGAGLMPEALGPFCALASHRRGSTASVQKYWRAMRPLCACWKMRIPPGGHTAPTLPERRVLCGRLAVRRPFVGILRPKQMKTTKRPPSEEKAS